MATSASTDSESEAALRQMLRGQAVVSAVCLQQ